MTNNPIIKINTSEDLLLAARKLNKNQNVPPSKELLTAAKDGINQAIPKVSNMSPTDICELMDEIDDYLSDVVFVSRILRVPKSAFVYAWDIDSISKTIQLLKAFYKLNLAIYRRLQEFTEDEKQNAQQNPEGIHCYLHIIATDLMHTLNTAKKRISKLSKLLSVKQSSYEHKEIKNIAEKIVNDCDPFLSEIDYNYRTYKLYRGINSSDSILRASPVLKKQRRDDRKPLDSNKIMHIAFNKVLEEVYGQPYRNAVFVVGDPNQAEPYGSLYVVFPIGYFEFVWSTVVKDVYCNLPGEISLQKIQNDFIIQHGYTPSVDELIDATVNVLKEKSIIEEMGYKATDLTAAIESGNEIMLWVDEYYAVRYDQYDQLCVELDRLLGKF